MALLGSIPDHSILAMFVVVCLLAAYQSLRLHRVGRIAGKSIKLLHRRRASFSNMRRALTMAEEVGRFGVWQYTPDDGRQYWSKGLRRLFGLQTGERMHEGDAETLLLSNGIDLGVLAAEAGQRDEAITTRFKILGLDDRERYLDMRMSTLRQVRKTGPRGVMAVFLDATQQSVREQQLQSLRQRALVEAEKARAEANRDPLTNLANRRYLMSELDRRLAHQNRTSDALSLILFDVDHFKLVNDRYGHPIGDKVLKRIARITGEQAREGDLVGRIGGEEFVWLLDGADADLAHAISERLRRAIAIGSGVGEAPPVTISIGCVTAEPGDTSLVLFARADEALYEAKNSGRNTVRIAA